MELKIIIEKYITTFKKYASSIIIEDSRLIKEGKDKPINGFTQGIDIYSSWIK